MDTWISDRTDPIDLKTKKTHLFCTFQSLGSWPMWPIWSRVITRFLQSLGSLTFHLFLVSMEFPRIHKWEKSETYNYVIKGTRGLCEWMAALITYSMTGSVGSPKFIYLGINISDHWSIFPWNYNMKRMILTLYYYSELLTNTWLFNVICHIYGNFSETFTRLY